MATLQEVKDQMEARIKVRGDRYSQAEQARADVAVLKYDLGYIAGLEDAVRMLGHVEEPQPTLFISNLSDYQRELLRRTITDHVHLDLKPIQQRSMEADDSHADDRWRSQEDVDPLVAEVEYLRAQLVSYIVKLQEAKEVKL